MAYSTAMMEERVAVLNPTDEQRGEFGKSSAGRKYQYTDTVWAGVHFNKGQKSMREGAYDAYDTVMFRMRWNDFTQRRSMLVWDGRTWEIRSFNRKYIDNEIQITAIESGKDLQNLVPTE